MSGSRTYFTVGIFVIVATALGVWAVFIFGVGSSTSRKKVLVETYMEQSVQGLEVGSKVRNLGVEVGQVTEIGFVDAEYRLGREFMTSHGGRWVLVRMAMFRDMLPAETVANIPRAVQAGVRTRLASHGLTGTKHVEVQLLDPERYPPLELDWEPKYPYVPSAPGTFARLAETVTKVGDTLDNAPVEEILEEARRLLRGLREGVDEADIGALGRKGRTTLDDARTVLNNPNIEAALADLRGATENARALVERLNREVSEEELRTTVTQLRGAIEGLPDAVDNLNRMIRRVEIMLVGQQEDFKRTTRDARVIFDNLRQLSADAKQYPAWVLFGEQPPRTHPLEAR